MGACADSSSSSSCTNENENAGAITIARQMQGDIRDYGIVNPNSQEYEFVPNMFLVPCKLKYALQQAVVCTQMFSSYVEDFELEEKG